MAERLQKGNWAHMAHHRAPGNPYCTYKTYWKCSAVGSSNRTCRGRTTSFRFDQSIHCLRMVGRRHPQSKACTCRQHTACTGHRLCSQSPRCRCRRTQRCSPRARSRMTGNSHRRSSLYDLCTCRQHNSCMVRHWAHFSQLRTDYN